nr:capsid protein [Picobirnavirus sp.]
MSKDMSNNAKTEELKGNKEGQNGNSMPKEKKEETSRLNRNQQKPNKNWNSNQGARKKGFNDPELYNKYPFLLESSARINNYHPLGLAGTDMLGKYKVAPIPGILNMDVLPAFPISYSATDTLNQAAFQTWTAIRDAISGSRPYDPVDVQLVMIATSQAVSCYYWLKRFFNFAYTFSATNRFTPEILFKAMHCDYDNFVRNIASYRSEFNRITINLSRMYSVQTGNYHDLITGVFAGVFQEPGANGQLYCYSPVGFYKYAWLDDSKGVKVGSLELVSLDNNDYVNLDPTGEVFLFSQLLQVYETLVNALIQDSDVNTIAGDIMHTWGESATKVNLPFVDEKASDIPRELLVDLSQFMTSSYFPADKLINYEKVTQEDAGYIKFTPSIEFSSTATSEREHNWHSYFESGFFNNGASNEDAIKTAYSHWMDMILDGNVIMLDDYVDLKVPKNVAELARNVMIYEPSITGFADDFRRFFDEGESETNKLQIRIKSCCCIIPLWLGMWYGSDPATDVISIRGYKPSTIKDQGRNFAFMPLRMAVDDVLDVDAVEDDKVKTS